MFHVSRPYLKSLEDVMGGVGWKGGSLTGEVRKETFFNLTNFERQLPNRFFQGQNQGGQMSL
jgi:hypothetical protein